ncbi:hypothetical protein D1646_18780 [Pseudoflavonifractor sp. 60]|uniref:DUF6709 family protein n=1 Tax=Pseudoflavonifractor sp. 60 TaxID=2304576 RepID=UPI0013680BCF|nr:DUF6709 family protein [Pseudoflavonifractor sp. 60]NBI68790.1 hypothetical protein [Pseudoflavonifractor sp. 60]
MKFKPEIPGAALPSQDLERDFSQARAVGKVRLGQQCLFLPKLSGTSYLPYAKILRAWLRQEEVKARMCCATANFDQFYLVMACAGGQERRWHVTDKADGQQCLDFILEKNPEVNIGYIKPGE